MANTVHGIFAVRVLHNKIEVYQQISSDNMLRTGGINFPIQQDLGGYQGDISGNGTTLELEQITGSGAGSTYTQNIATTWNTINANVNSGSNFDFIYKTFTGLAAGEKYRLRSTNYDGDVLTHEFFTNPLSSWGSYGGIGKAIQYNYQPNTGVLEVSIDYQEGAGNVSSALRNDLTFREVGNISNTKTILNPATNGNVTQNYDSYVYLYNPSLVGYTNGNAAVYAALKNGCFGYSGDCHNYFTSQNPPIPATNDYQKHAVDLSGAPTAYEWEWNIPGDGRLIALHSTEWTDGHWNPPASVSGCTDPTAFNYDPLATIDDGSCCFVSGCTDPTASNYDPTACHDDGSCVIPTGSTTCDGIMGHFSMMASTTPVTSLGATDGRVRVYINYDIAAWNTNSSSCTPACVEDDFSKDFRFDITITEWDGGTNSAVAGGYTNSASNVAIPNFSNPNLSTTGNVLNSSSIPWLDDLPEANYKVEAVMVSVTGEGTPQNCECISYLPNGSQAPWDSDWIGCTEGMILSVGRAGGPVAGCTDPTASNYNPSATQDCTHLNPVPSPECDTPTSTCCCTYTSSPVYGCTNPLASNYDPSATIDNGSCVFPSSMYGCTNPAASNYDPSAVFDDGSCIVPIYGCTDPNSVNYNPLATVDNGSCIPCVNGCTNLGSPNYNPLATCDDGSCLGCVYGCTNPNSSNYNQNATCDDGSCCVDGCTDPTAINYNVLATCDDNSCQYCVYGCTDPNASNYDALATCDDGSCIESECSDCYKLLNVLYKEANCEGCNEDDYIEEKRNLQRFTNLRVMRDIAYECGDTAYVSTMQAEEYQICSTLLDEHTNEGTNNDYKVYGCTNPTSLNYNPKATHPCEKNGIYNYCCGDTKPLQISGCIDPLATNYNANANIDDGSCTY